MILAVTVKAIWRCWVKVTSDCSSWELALILQLDLTRALNTLTNIGPDAPAWLLCTTPLV